MNNLPYNQTDKKSILDYAKLLKDKSLRQVCSKDILAHGYSGKGNFGQLVEKFYFGYEPNSKSEADFSDIGLELKTSPLKQLKNNEFRAKERLVLSIIDYLKIVNQNFDNSDFWRKSANILLVFYLHQAGIGPLDLIIKLVDEWIFPEKDLEIIKKDWNIIRDKVIAGKAHELSEGDTFYLGACTKGTNAASVRTQPNSAIPAKQRAYSLKQGYVNHMIASLANEPTEVYGKLITSVQVAKEMTIEEVVISRFEPYYGMTVEQITEKTEKQLNTSAKNFYANLTKAILGISLDKEIEEFEKAEVIIRTVRLKENFLPKEDISFPNFKYEEIISEEWEESDIKDILEHKFMFVFFLYQGDNLVLKKVKFWNMPYEDLLEVSRVWKKTKNIISNGAIVSSLKTDRNGKIIRVTNFPSKAFSNIAHVRPHALNSADTYALPVPDKITGLTEYTKHCFWLNSSYVRDKIFN